MAVQYVARAGVERKKRRAKQAGRRPWRPRAKGIVNANNPFDYQRQKIGNMAQKEQFLFRTERKKKSDERRG